MKQRAWTLVSSFVILTAVGMAACSSADTPEEDDGDNGGGTGGATPTGGASGTGAGGTASGTGGAAGSGATTSGGSTSTGGAGGGGAGDMPNPDPECKGISRDMPCTLEGKMCPNLACGIADSGRRECNCATNWTCTSCDYTNSPFRDMPADIPMCPAGVGDEVTCTNVNTVCGPMGAEYCACYQDATDGLIWDCDDPPTTWPI
jgi:hypothetical protein